MFLFFKDFFYLSFFRGLYFLPRKSEHPNYEKYLIMSTLLQTNSKIKVTDTETLICWASALQLHSMKDTTLRWKVKCYCEMLSEDWLQIHIQMPLCIPMCISCLHSALSLHGAQYQQYFKIVQLGLIW